VTQFRTRPNAPSWSSCPSRRLARLLEGLSDDAWEQPSLCAGWRIRDVAAHVAMASQIPGLGPRLADGIRARGSFHRLNHDIAVRHAARPPQRTSLPSCSGTRILAGYPVVTNYCNILFDVLVHAQDIAIPLGRDYPMPPEAARAGADRVWTMGRPFCARPDSAGSGCSPPISTGPLAGAELRGPIGMLRVWVRS
jgi:uncharacterized protein (TIGR03083 family)